MDIATGKRGEAGKRLVRNSAYNRVCSDVIGGSRGLLQGPGRLSQTSSSCLRLLDGIGESRLSGSCCRENLKWFVPPSFPTMRVRGGQLPIAASLASALRRCRGLAEADGSYRDPKNSRVRKAHDAPWPKSFSRIFSILV